MDDRQDDTVLGSIDNSGDGTMDYTLFYSTDLSRWNRVDVSIVGVRNGSLTCLPLGIRYYTELKWVP